MNARVGMAAVLPALLLAACTVPRPATQPANGTGTAGVGLTPLQLRAAVQGDADRMEKSKDATERAQLLAAATLSAQQCLAQAPHNAACPYAQAQVLGLTARERPLQAVPFLKEMLASLRQAEALDPALDHAGPARLSAIVLLRAPPWPLGPGDVDAAVTAAQRAVQQDAAYPPNLITLGQAQARSDGAALARATFEKARLAVQAWTVAADRAAWQQAVEQGLQGLQ